MTEEERYLARLDKIRPSETKPYSHERYMKPHRKLKALPPEKLATFALRKFLAHCRSSDMCDDLTRNYQDMCRKFYDLKDTSKREAEASQREISSLKKELSDLRKDHEKLLALGKPMDRKKVNAATVAKQLRLVREQIENATKHGRHYLAVSPELLCVEAMAKLEAEGFTLSETTIDAPSHLNVGARNPKLAILVQWGTTYTEVGKPLQLKGADS